MSYFNMHTIYYTGINGMLIFEEMIFKLKPKSDRHDKNFIKVFQVEYMGHLQSFEADKRKYHCLLKSIPQYAQKLKRENIY